MDYDNVGRGDMETNAIRRILSGLEANVSTARKSRDRNLMRETVIRIRQLRGLLEVRG